MNGKVALRLQWLGLILALMSMVLICILSLFQKSSPPLVQVLTALLAVVGIIGGWVLTQCPIWLAPKPCHICGSIRIISATANLCSAGCGLGGGWKHD
jgi:4-hydroxybenzoate polyprenyltransferase